MSEASPPHGDTLEREHLDAHDPAAAMSGEATPPVAPMPEEALITPAAGDTEAQPAAPETQTRLARAADRIGGLVMKTLYRNTAERITAEVKQKTTQHVAAGQAAAVRGDLAGARDRSMEIHRTAEQEVKLPRGARLAARLGVRSVVETLSAARTEASQEQRKAVEAAGENWQQKFIQSADQARKEGRPEEHDRTLAYVAGQMEQNKEDGWEKPLMQVAVEARARGDDETYKTVVAHLQQRLEAHKASGDMSTQKVSGALRALGNRVTHIDAERAKVAAMEQAQQRQAEALDPRRVLGVREAIEERVRKATEAAKDATGNLRSGFDAKQVREDAIHELTLDHLGVTEKDYATIPQDVRNQVDTMLRGSLVELRQKAKDAADNDRQHTKAEGVLPKTAEKKRFGKPAIIEVDPETGEQRPQTEYEEPAGPSFKPRIHKDPNNPNAPGKLVDADGDRRHGENVALRRKMKGSSIEYSSVGRNNKVRGRADRVTNAFAARRGRKLLAKGDKEIAEIKASQAAIDTDVRKLNLSPTSLSELLHLKSVQSHDLEGLIEYLSSGDSPESQAAAAELRQKAPLILEVTDRFRGRAGVASSADRLYKEHKKAQAEMAANDPSSNVSSLNQAHARRTARENNENGRPRPEARTAANSNVELVLNISVGELAGAQGQAIDSLADSYKYVLTAREGTKYTKRDGTTGIITQDVKDGVVHTLVSAARSFNTPAASARINAILRDSLPADEFARLQGKGETTTNQPRPRRTTNGNPRGGNRNGPRQNGRPGPGNGRPGTGRPRVNPAA